MVRSAFPDSASFELDEPDELGNFTDPTLAYDRFIFFGGTRTIPGPQASGASIDFANPTNIQTLIANENISDMTGMENNVFFARTNAYNPASERLLSPGQYLTLSPRSTTHLGSRSDGSGNPLYPSRQRFARFGSGLAHYRNETRTVNPPTEIRTSPTFNGSAYHTVAQTLVIDSFLPAGWSTTTFEHGVVGLSVSEPFHNAYYPVVPTRRYNGTQNNDGFAGIDYPLFDAYLDLDDTSISETTNIPADVTAGILPIVGTPPDAEPQLGTIPSYCSAFLQRLADPTLPHDPVTNPYRTVDWLQIDLTVFSGEARPGADMGQGGALYTTRSRQRTGDGADILYSYEVNDSDLTPGSMVTVADASLTDLDFFNLQNAGATNPERFLFSSLSFLNTATYTENQFVVASAGDEAENGHCNPGFTGYTASIGALGSPTADNVVGNDRNVPQVVYALHPWLNRPFSSPLELMMVPACSQGRLFEEFSINTGGDPDIYVNPGDTPGDNATKFNAPFRHLLNFFHSSFDPSEGAQFTRLFDLVHTLPRFAGEIEMIDPERLTSANASQNAELNLLRTLLQPPFNFRYSNVRQGTVNLNSLSEFPVWAGLMQGHLNPAEFSDPSGGGTATQLAFDQFVTNRRGYAPGTRETVTGGMMPNYNYDEDKLDPRFPTQFAGVYKDAMNTHFAPQLRSAADTDLLRRRGVNGSLLRGGATLDVNDPVGGPPGTTSLFIRDATQDPMTVHQDRNRNAFLRYQTLMRMPNLSSKNSQTFVIRLTMGFFEVDANDITSVGQEYNASLGENERYRALFLIDRSKPVGFVAGENLNARDVVIYESYDQ